MTDISEAEAILHLKRALGEIEVGDALPSPLPPVQQKPSPPPAKVPKTAPAQQPKSMVPMPTPVQPSIGPTPRNETRVSQSSPQHPVQKRGVQGGAARQQPMGGGMPPMAPMGQPGGAPQLNNFLSHNMQAGAVGSSAAPRNVAMMGMPPPPGMGGTNQQPGGGAGTGGGASAQAAAAAASSGKKQKEFEIPQGKVGLVIGKGSVTMIAIKTYSKAQFFIEQNSPDEEKATVFVVGTDKEMAKCKQTVLAIVDGSMSVSTLFTLAGMPMPKGGVEDWDPMKGDQNVCMGGAGSGCMGGPPAGGCAWAPPSMLAPTGMPGGPMCGQAMPPMGAAPLPVPASGGPMTPMMFAAAAGLAGSAPPMPGAIPGMPENQQMQQNLNDYYARWWSTYAQQQQKDGEEGASSPNIDDQEMIGGAFDKDALQRLADRAAKGIQDPAPESALAKPQETSTIPPGPPAEIEGGACDCGQPFNANANFCSSCGSKIKRAAAPTQPQSTDGAGRYATMPSATAPSSAMATLSQPGRGPITLKGFLRSAEPQKAKKDDDAVQNMMERLQGNVVQTKQAMAMNEVAPPPKAPSRGGVGIGMMGVDDDPRTRADYEFENLMSRMQGAEYAEDVENVAREILIRCPSFNSQQITELLTKLNSATSVQSHQHGDFMTEICRMLLPRLKEFNTAQFTSLVSSLASWTRRPDRPKSTRYQDVSKMFFTASSLEMSSRLMTFAPHELNCCLAAFVSIGFNEHKFFSSVGRAALARHSSFAPVQLTALLAILSEMRLMHTDLFNAAGAFLSTRSAELRPVDMIRVLRSFAKCGVSHPILCKAVGDEVIRRSRDKHSGVTFKAEEMCEIGWALCTLQQYHEAVFRLMFKALEKVPTVACESLLQLFEVHWALETEQKEVYSRFRPERHVIEALEDHYKENRKDERRCSERLRNDVAAVLKSLVDGSVHVNHRTSSGLLVDVVALRKRSSTDGFIHVDLESNMTAVRSLDTDDQAQAPVVTEGTVALKRRLLQKIGLRLVTVKESEWRDLDDSKDKRRYLRNLLSNLSDVLQ